MSNQMFTLLKEKNGNVRQLTFKKTLEYFHVPHEWKLVHEELAEEYAKMPWNYLTVIIETESLDERLWDDPKHTLITNEIWCCEVELEARKRAQNHFFTSEEIENIFKENQFPQTRYNWKEEDCKERIKTELEDAIYEAQVKMLYPEIVEEFKRECRYEYDEDQEEEIKLSSHAFAKKWKKRHLEIFLPRVHQNAKRVFPNTPEPFGHSSFAQYFLIEKEHKIEWVYGASSGSYTRYAHGLMGHLFATLTKKYNKTIPTYYFKNTKKNDFKYIEEWDSFKVDRHELTGNYPARWEHSEPLFEGLLFDKWPLSSS